MRLALLGFLVGVAVAVGGLGCGDDDGTSGSVARKSTAATAPTATDPAVNPTPRPTSGDILVASLGDSITAGSPLYDPDPAVRARLGAELQPRSQYEYWFTRKNPRVTFRNCGIFGQRTDEIAQRLPACAKGAQVLIVQGGINDIAQGRPVADAADDITSMLRAGKRLGLKVATVEVLPWNNGYPQAAPLIDELNGLIRRAAKAEGVPVFPWYEALEDPATPGRMGKGLTDDGNHPSVAGYRRLADAVTLP